MPVLARRRIQAMLDDLAPLLDGGKGRDMVRRLRRKEVEQVLPAEMELALLWALAKTGNLQVEPEWSPGGKRPDAYSDMLIPGKGCAIEITAPSDNAISGEADMDRIARQIAACVDEVKKGVGAFLYFTFLETNGFRDGQYYRYRLAPADYELTERASASIRAWAATPMQSPLEFRDGTMQVNVIRKERRQVRCHNIHSSMPAETHSLNDNPLFQLLERKMKQLRDVPAGALRIIFLADAGSSLLRDVYRSDDANRGQMRKSGSDIIWHFLRGRGREIDAVVVFSPYTEYSTFPDPFGRAPQRWNVSFFGNDNLPDIPEALHDVAAALPPPHYQGYQARSLFRQGSFTPKSRGQYLGMSWTIGKDGRRSMRLPARMLLDLLAGRLSEDSFRSMIDGGGRQSNIFKLWLEHGYTISGAEMLPRDIDEDDDHLVLHFTEDAAASEFRLPGDGKTGSDPGEETSAG